MYIVEKICLEFSSFYLAQKCHHEQMMLLAIHKLSDDKGQI
jgi:hypothetical protein